MTNRQALKDSCAAAAAAAAVAVSSSDRGPHLRGEMARGKASSTRRRS